ncbi:hypothetical protein DVQ33_07025 [Yersinia enterocolitica]|nr:hypothetical protein FORC2_1091 [Yersinia enterocolitica]ALG46166.1 hypothetical protein LI89_16020 [Yersinia enterocolitica]EKN4916028.1 hypothetical protein [Yersinia enterocolitica]EKN4922579.1 hypothetical protein [Yersinia enterocolitica]EKN4935215.1 hypothetical protein [Yersinia enterocolitica]
MEPHYLIFKALQHCTERSTAQFLEDKRPLNIRSRFEPFLLEVAAVLLTATPVAWVLTCQTGILNKD